MSKSISMDSAQALKRGRLQAGIVGLAVILIVTAADWTFEWRSNKELEASVKTLNRENQQLKLDNGDAQQKLLYFNQQVPIITAELAETKRFVKELEKHLGGFRTDDNNEYLEHLDCVLILDDSKNTTRSLAASFLKLEENVSRLTRTSPTQEAEIAPSPTVPKAVTVYVTNTGKKYHRAGCQHLSRSKIPIKLSDAKEGGYQPCSKCNPPE